MLWRSQDCKYKFLWRILILSNLCQVKDLLLADCDSIVNGLAMEINTPLCIFCIINIIKDLPCNVPVDLLLRIFILLLIHWVTSLERILILSIQIFVHLCSQVLVLIFKLVISFLDHLMLLLWAKLILLWH
jgi:hypothetical protein